MLIAMTSGVSNDERPKQKDSPAPHYCRKPCTEQMKKAGRKEVKLKTSSTSSRASHQSDEAAGRSRCTDMEARRQKQPSWHPNAARGARKPQTLRREPGQSPGRGASPASKRSLTPAVSSEDAAPKSFATPSRTVAKCDVHRKNTTSYVDVVGVRPGAEGLLMSR